MPIYPYRCTQCGHTFEKIQSFNSEPETKCPQCGGKLERPLTAPGLQFKGAGWYVTDYASKGAAAKSESAKSESSSSSTESSSSAASKSAETKTSSSESAPPASAPKSDAAKS